MMLSVTDVGRSLSMLSLSFHALVADMSTSALCWFVMVKLLPLALTEES